MAALCCSAARISPSLLRTRTGAVSTNSVSLEIGFPFRAVRGIEVKRSVLVTCLGDYAKTAVVTGKTWNNLILNSSTPVVVEFYASWCGPCRMVHRIIDEIATEYSGRIKVFVLDADQDLQLAEDYDVKAVPVVLLFKNGKKHDSVVGTMPKEFYVAAIERLLTS